MIPREVGKTALAQEAVEAFNRIVAIYGSTHTTLSEAWRTMEQVVRVLIGRIDELEKMLLISHPPRDAEHRRT